MKVNFEIKPVINLRRKAVGATWRQLTMRGLEEYEQDYLKRYNRRYETGEDNLRTQGDVWADRK